MQAFLPGALAADHFVSVHVWREPFENTEPQILNERSGFQIADDDTTIEQTSRNVKPVTCSGSETNMSGNCLDQSLGKQPDLEQSRVRMFKHALFGERSMHNKHGIVRGQELKVDGLGVRHCCGKRPKDSNPGGATVHVLDAGFKLEALAI